MADFDDANFGAIRFSEGIYEGMDAAAPEVAPAPAADGPESDVAPTEHHSILDTPVEMPTPGKSKRRSQLEIQLEAQYAMLGTALFLIDPQTSAVVLHQAPKCAAALTELANKNPAVKNALESLMTTSAWGAVITAHLPIVVQVGTKYVPMLRERYSDTVAQHQAGEDAA